MDKFHLTFGVWLLQCLYYTSMSFDALACFAVAAIRCTRSDVEVLVDDMVAREPLISENRKPQLRRLIYKLIEKLETNEVCRYSP